MVFHIAIFILFTVRTKAGKLLFLASAYHSILETFFYYLLFFGQSKYLDESIIKIKSTNSQKQKYLKEKPPNHKNSSYLSYDEIKNHINRISLNDKVDVLKFFSKYLEKNSSLEKFFNHKYKITCQYTDDENDNQFNN